MDIMKYEITDDKSENDLTHIWLVVLTIQKKILVTGKDCPIYYGK